MSSRRSVSTYVQYKVSEYSCPVQCHSCPVHSEYSCPVQGQCVLMPSTRSVRSHVQYKVSAYSCPVQGQCVLMSSTRSVRTHDLYLHRKSSSRSCVSTNLEYSVLRELYMTSSTHAVLTTNAHLGQLQVSSHSLISAGVFIIISYQFSVQVVLECW